MKKFLFVILIISTLFADNAKFIKSLIGEDKFNNYYELLKPVLNENSLVKTIEYLQNNGLLDIFFDKPEIIHPHFIFLDNNPVFNTKILYNTLNYMGYYYFYPIKIKKSEKSYSLTLEMRSTHYIDPLVFINTIKQKGCRVKSISKTDDYIYTIDCKNEFLNATSVINKKIKLLNAKGIYWINPNGFKKILISTSKLDNWYPHIVFFDKNLNILNIISRQNSQKIIYLNLSAECKYIKITDTFSKVNFKRGIYIKGIQ
jgi:hypothetical protein